MRYLIGLDLGTTSVKGILLDESGKIPAIAAMEYALESGADEKCEVDPQVYWDTTCQIIGELLHKSEIAPEQVAGMAVSSQGETLICLDEKGRPLRKAIVWLDNRSVRQAGEIARRFGNEQILATTGQPEVLPLWPATRILWLREQEPEIFRRTAKYLLVEDYLMYRLTGRFCTDYSMASDTLYFDIRKKNWWDDMLAFLGISHDNLPELLPSGSPVSRLTPDACQDTGLTANTLCITGAYDHPAGAIGAGNLEPGMVTLTIGASMAMCVTLQEPLADAMLRLSCQCHALDGRYFLLPYAHTAGMVLKWFRDEFYVKEKEEALRTGTDPYDLMTAHAALVSPGSDGLVMLPHLMGTGSPEFNPHARGSFTGITLGMTRGHFVRAIMESVACTVESNLSALHMRNIMVSEIRVLGGASRSPLWNQIMADVTGIPVITMTQSENASLGAAILAGKGTGIFTSIENACRLCIVTGQNYLPDPSRRDLYQKLANRYRHLYNSLENYWKLA